MVSGRGRAIEAGAKDVLGPAAVVLCAALLAFLLAPEPLAAQQARVEWSGEMAEGRALEVRGISGRISAVAATGSRAEVVAVKRGDENDFGAVDVVVEDEGGDVTVCAVYRRANPTSCSGDQDRDESWRNRSIQVHVDFEVRVPAGVEFEGTMVSGDVRAEELRSDVRASTVSGDVYVSTSGVGWGTTVSGDIEIRMGTASTEAMEFNTVSGDIVLHLPADIGADVEFHSVSGDFESDLPIEVTRRSGRFVGSELEGRIGTGGPLIEFQTVSGDVRLRPLG